MNHNKRLTSISVKVKQLLASPNLLIMIFGITFLLIIPGLDEGFFLDDWFQKLKYDRKVPINYSEAFSFFGQYSFIQGDEKQISEAIDSGLFPWWSHENLKLSFWRPLTEITFLLDYKLWPNHSLFMHLHSFFWYLIILILLFLYYRQVIDIKWLAGFALLLFAFDSSHIMPIVWLANRNALIATAFGLGCLLLHDLWRKNNIKLGAIFAPILLSLSLLSAEFGIGICAYLFAYALIIDNKTFLSRMLSLLPYVIIAMLWRGVYHLLDYGSFGSGTYVDPGGNPFRFLGVIGERLPILLNAQLGFFSSNLYKLIPQQYKIIFWAMTVVCSTALIILLISLLKSDKIARFWGLGMVLSLIPVCAAMPDDRLLLLSGIGGMALLALLFKHWFEKSNGYSKKNRVLSGIMVFILLFIHLILAPLAKLQNSQFYQVLRPVIDQPAADSVLLPDHPDQLVIVLNPPGSFLFFHYTIVKILNQNNQTFKYMALANANSKLKIVHKNEYTLEISAENGYYPFFWDQHFRDPRHHFSVGQHISTKQINITILSLNANKMPHTVRFEFDKILDNNSYKFLSWNTDHYERYTLPNMGQFNYLDEFSVINYMQNNR
ncbi:MAG: hypothetical protein MJB14_15420 [Spirochaetes bacterium]|nr:hypothetical protein [Spirochaetota bacterium]